MKKLIVKKNKRFFPQMLYYAAVDINQIEGERMGSSEESF